MLSDICEARMSAREGIRWPMSAVRVLHRLWATALAASLLAALLPAWAATIPVSMLAETAGRTKEAPATLARQRVIAPLDRQLIYSRPQLCAWLPSIPEAAIIALKQQNAEEDTRRLQIGLSRPFDNPIIVNRQTTLPGQWTLLTNGCHILSARVVSAGARGLRLHFEGVSLPSGAQFVIHDPSNLALASITIEAKSFETEPDLWAPTLFAEQAVIECQLPPGVEPAAVAFTISGVSHIYDGPVPGRFSKEGSCEVDVSCYPEYAQQAAGVAMISYVHAGNTYLCTGCLLESTYHSTAEYFLTARHCIGNQTLASTLEFVWFFQTTNCNGTPPDSASVPTTSGGAELLATGVSDFALLRLRKPAPPGVFYLGWTLDRPSAAETLAGIHHPDGSYKRICLGTFFDSDIYHTGVQWSTGVTESGSSGSPLLNGAHQVIGQLSGGFNGPGSSCDNPTAPDEYGRFDVAYPFIKKWIDPAGTSGPSFVPATYYGLFYDQSNGVSQASSGSFTVRVTAKGKYTGKLQSAGATASFAGELDLNGASTVNVSRRKLTPLAMQIQVNLGQGADTLTGLVSDGNWTATLFAERAGLDGKTAFSAQAGRYTLLIPAGDGSGTGGDSFGSVIVTRTGRLTVMVSLSDRTKATQSTFVSREGHWPLYLPLYKGQGSLFSWVTFENTSLSDLDGQLYWNTPALTNGVPPASQLTGCAYTRPGPGSSLLNFTNGTVTLSGGALSQDLQAQIQLRPSGNLITQSGLDIKLDFGRSTGVFNGSATDSGTKQSFFLHGVALQKQNLASGYFTGSTTGKVVIEP
jgi:lysyl endopeptidase